MSGADRFPRNEADPTRDRRFVGDDDFLKAFGEALRSALNLDTWDAGVDPQRMLERFREQILQSTNREDRVRDIVRGELFPRIPSSPQAPPEAGLYLASTERVKLIHETLLFPGHVEAVNSMVLSHDSLPLGITQIGVSLVGYGGNTGVFSQRLFRKEMSAQIEGLNEAIALIEQRQEHSGPGRQDVMPMLARRNIRAYAERAVLVDRAKAEWRMGHGNPFSQDMISTYRYATLLLESLKLLRRLVEQQPKFVFVSDASEDLGLLTLGNALNAGEYLILDTLHGDTQAMVERWNYEAVSKREADRFVKECAPRVLRGLLRPSDHAPPCLFYAHREHVHIAAHIAMADSILRAERAFPMLLDVADVACRGAFGADGFLGMMQDAYTRAGAKYQYLNSRRKRR